jgi:hypothetical protein
MQGYTVRKKSSTVYDVATEIVLLSVAPMERVDDDVVDTERIGNDRATSFTAKTQSDPLKKIVRFYGLQFDQCCMCLIGDNA